MKFPTSFLLEVKPVIDKIINPFKCLEMWLLPSVFRWTCTVKPQMIPY